MYVRMYTHTHIYTWITQWKFWLHYQIFFKNNKIKWRFGGGEGHGRYVVFCLFSRCELKIAYLAVFQISGKTIQELKI